MLFDFAGGNWLGITIFCLPVIISSHQKVIAQLTKDEAQKIGVRATTLYDEKKLEDAMPLYEQLLKYDPVNIEYNARLGIIYYYCSHNITNAIDYLEMAAGNENTEPELQLYLAKAYHLNYQFIDAIHWYNKYKKSITMFEYKLQREADMQIKMCLYAIECVKLESVTEVINLGDSVNSIYDDYCPAISADGESLIFTSRRPSRMSNEMTADGKYFEDIYKASFNRGNCTEKSHLVSDNINSREHDASVGLSHDGQKMFIYKFGDIYMAELHGDKWGFPQRLDDHVNSKYWETHATISIDNKVIYFVSDRKGGYGGSDIYRVVKEENGKWSKVENLGAKINTKFEEDAPFIHADDKTIYFSSKGHHSMGGFDVYRSDLRKGEWSAPVNMGHPINTPGDDIYFVMSADKNTGYISSNRTGSLGDKDIFKVILPDTGKVPLTVVSGKVYGENEEIIPTKIIVRDKITDKVIGTYEANTKTGKYLLVFPPNKNYNFLIMAQGYLPYSEDVFIPEQKDFYKVYQEIQLSKVKRGDKIVGQKIVMRNAFFDIDKVIEKDIPLLKNKNKEHAYSAFVGYLNHKNEINSNLQHQAGLDAAVADAGVLDQDHLNEISEVYIFEEPGRRELKEIDIDGYIVHSLSAELNSHIDEDSLSSEYIIQPTIDTDYESFENEVQVLGELNSIEAQLAAMSSKYGETEDQENKIRDELVTSAKEQDELLNKFKNNKEVKQKIKDVQFDLLKLRSNQALHNVDDRKEKVCELKTEISSLQVALMYSAKENQVYDIKDYTTLTDEELIAKISDSRAISYNLGAIVPTKFDHQLMHDIIELMENNDSLRLEIRGFTCTLGDVEANKLLAQSRANLLSDYFYMKGIDRARLVAIGMGESYEFTNFTEEGRGLNRRIQFNLKPI